MSKFDETQVEIVEDRTLWKGWSHVRAVTFDYRDAEGETKRHQWEVFDRGEAVAILLHDPERDLVVLVRQFRIPAHLNGDPAYLLEVPAGMLEKDEDPAESVAREVMEETGYRITSPNKLFSVYMSPGSLTEKVHFFESAVSLSDKIAAGGGLAEEHEDIELVEMPLTDALAMVASGGIVDGKTIMLLQWLALQRATSR